MEINRIQDLIKYQYIQVISYDTKTVLQLVQLLSKIVKPVKIEIDMGLYKKVETV